MREKYKNTKHERKTNDMEIEYKEYDFSPV